MAGYFVTHFEEVHIMKVHNQKTIHKLNNNGSVYGRVGGYTYRIVGLLVSGENEW